MMIGRFTKVRQRRYLKQMIVWTIGMFLVVPLAMIVFPYVIAMPFERYSSSPSELFKQGGIYFILVLWLLGAVAALIAYILNPFKKHECLSSGETLEETEHNNTNPADAQRG